MKLYIADNGDTLRLIARKNRSSLQKLLSLNPHIPHPDLKISGLTVRMPLLSQAAGQQPPSPATSFNTTIDQDQWIPLATLEQMAQTDYDVLVVGTGIGGGAALWRLADRLQNGGRRIGVIERGGLLLPTHAQNVATMSFRSKNVYFNNIVSREIDTNAFLTRLVYALGGRSLFWASSCIRMPVSELAGWPVPVKEMNVYYRIAEKAMSVSQLYTKDSAITQILLDRLQTGGFPEAEDEPLALNLQPSSQFGVINSNVVFSSLVWLGQAMNRSFDLAVNARAVEVLINRNRAVGVKVMSPDKKTYELQARNVILSASTMGTTQILLNSDIQESAIGSFLASHTRFTATGTVSRSRFPENLGPLNIVIPGTAQRSYQIQIQGPGPYRFSQYQVQPLQNELEVAFYASGKVESRSDNQVWLDPHRRDDYGVPELNVRFSYSERDLAVAGQMAEGVQKAAAVLNAPLRERDGEALSLGIAGGDHHEMGTCRMGDDPKTSAANRYGQIHGVQGLYVADNSVIPTCGTANPSLTNAALAIRTADYIADRLK